jgi:hypothetical protein
MKFDDLCNLVTESGFRPGAAKNRGLYSRSRETDPTKGSLRSGGAFAVTNPEKRVALNRWEFKASEAKDSGKLEGSMVWNTFKNAFGLLLNNGMFKSRLKSLIKDFNENRQSISDDDEKLLDNLYRAESKKSGELSSLQSVLDGLKNQVSDYNRYAKMSADGKRDFAKNVGSARGTVDALLKSIKDSPKKSEVTKLLKQMENYKFLLSQNTNNPDKLAKIKSEINNTKKKLRDKEIAAIVRSMEDLEVEKDILSRLEDQLNNAKMSNSQLSQIQTQIDRLESKIGDDESGLTQEYNEIVLKLDETSKRLGFVGEQNKKLNDLAIEKLKKEITDYAKMILDKLDTDKIAEKKSLKDLNWNELGGRSEQIAALEALTRLDNTNPIVGYLERFQRAYENNEFDVGKALNKNINISTVRDFESLPFFTFARIFKYMENENAIHQQKIVEVDEDSPVHKQALQDIANIVSGKEYVKDKSLVAGIHKMWADKDVKESLRDAVNRLQIPPKYKDNLYADIMREFAVARDGATSFRMFKSRTDAAIKDVKKSVYKESFDVVAARILESFSFDEDDYKLDLMEIFEEKSKKCTGPTKKASSDRKGKKWTKCARQSDGSYKRIHWGQKGVRVTGKSGNTKRKKSFKKRHNCSNAKAGSPQAMACKDWA